MLIRCIYPSVLVENDLQTVFFLKWEQPESLVIRKLQYKLWCSISMEPFAAIKMLFMRHIKPHENCWYRENAKFYINYDK